MTAIRRAVLRTGGWAVAFLLAGCAPPKEPVYVDLAATIAQDRTVKPRDPAIPAPPATMAAQSVMQPGRAREALRDPSESSEADVRSAIAEDQYRDYLRLVERLKEFYRADSDRFEQELLRGQSERAVEAYRSIRAQIREIFERYGYERGPLVARLALLAGYPDPNPNSTPPPRFQGNVHRQLFEEARDLRQKVRALDAAFDARIEALMKGVAGDLAGELDALRKRIAEYRDANNRRAEDEADDQVRQNARELGLTLTDPVRLRLAAVPPRVVALPGGPAPKAAPQVTSKGILALPADRRLLAERQLRIWLGQNRYALAASPAGAKDKTKEFIAWRTRVLNGR